MNQFLAVALLAVGILLVIRFGIAVKKRLAAKRIAKEQEKAALEALKQECNQAWAERKVG